MKKLITAIVFLTLFAAGAAQEPAPPLMTPTPVVIGNQPPLWGNGNPSPDWQRFFGNGNISRLNYVQTQIIDGLGQRVAELAEQVRKLEEVASGGTPDPNTNRVK